MVGRYPQPTESISMNRFLLLAVTVAFGVLSSCQRAGGDASTRTIQTAPDRDTPFRFCVVDSAAGSAEHIEETLPDFVILAGADSATIAGIRRGLSDLATGVPIFAAPDTFTWGNSFFVCGNALPRSGSREAEHRFLITSAGPENNAGDIVFSSGGDGLSVKRSDTSAYVQLGRTALLVEVQGPEVRAGAVESAEPDRLPLTLSEGKVSYRRTCVYCRRLLETRQYLKSIEYYKRFMARTPERILHDDALYQIAHIYDHYLFEYPAALEHYRELVREYPQSPLSRSARFRMDYIQAHDDHDYEVLAVFERARLDQPNREPGSDIDTVEAILEKYPRNSLRDQMLMWLGTAHAPENGEKALSFFEQAASSQDSTIRYKASLAIGDLHYRAKRYRTARKIYGSLLEGFPSHRADLAAKIARSGRNMRREVIRWVAIVAIVACVALAGLLPPRGLGRPPLGPLSLVAVGYSAAAAIPLALYYDHLSRQVGYAAWVVVSMVGVAYLLMEFGRKIRRRIAASVPRICVAVVFGLVLTLCVLYILEYRAHFLFLFERMFS